ncbi:glucoamylase [Roridomyces roridus]|uniref:Glucoamylase n=1 Tax=Roridomyces roridus TaxID=1738132 RepID=A0AAD7FXQ3_9AGAR|nr:glucoamylase [Roridomyces roridus]
MRLLLVSALSLCTAVLARSVDSYVVSEAAIAKAGLLANIGPSGSKASGASPGVVIASPNTVEPNYLYTWVRDSSLVFKVLIDQFTTGQDPSLQDHVVNFIDAESKLQQLANPSGNLTTGGLGEPKFNINITAFTDSWGRPQRDGPALRSTAVITYANWLLKRSSSSNVLETLWPMIKLDLDYVAANWNQSSFDLWEEVESSSFFTTAVQHRALREGAALAKTLKQNATAYLTQADNVLCFLQSYWNEEKGYLTANTGGGRSGIDANTLLASIHTFDPAAGCDAHTFQPCSDKALSNLKVYVDSFRSIYALNNGTASNAAVATGRYPEDVYMATTPGLAISNPWYLTTAAVAEQLYDALLVWERQLKIEVTETSLSFFQQFEPKVKVGTYGLLSLTYIKLLAEVKAFAEGALAIHAKYTPSNGALSEQFDKTNGTQVSAKDLTWSYAAALTMFSARASKVPLSWGAAGLTVPKVCKPGPPLPTSTVTFTVDATTVAGESILLTGSIAELQSWSPTTALPMTADGSTWSVTVVVPASTIVDFKYIRMLDGAVTWESDPNNEITTPAEGGEATIDDVWR